MTDQEYLLHCLRETLGELAQAGLIYTVALAAYWLLV